MSGWFDEQLRARARADEYALTRSLGKISEAVSGRSFLDLDADDEGTASDAVNEIMRWYNVPKSQQHTVMRRNVELKDGWYKDAGGAYLGRTKEGRYVALIPSRFSGYSYKDRITGKRVRVNANTPLETQAVCFYRPLPSRSIGTADIIAFMLKNISLMDIAYVAAISLVITLASMIAPFLTQKIYSEVVYAATSQPLVSIVIFLAGGSISTTLLAASRSLIVARMEIKSTVSLQAAMMMRLINLPADFFKKYSAGELSQRVSYVNILCGMVIRSIFPALLTALMSLIYLRQIFLLAPALAFPAFCVMALMLLLAVITVLVQSPVLLEQMHLKTEENGLVYSLITGIKKLKLAGAERRAFALWGEQYSLGAKLEYDPPVFMKTRQAFQFAITFAGSFVLYWEAFRSGVPVHDYMAFMVSYSLLSGAFIALCEAAVYASSLVPVMDLIRPIMEAEPETTDDSEAVQRIRGSIELDNVSFRYDENMPFVLENLSLRIRAGEYVAIVGKSGCGKSTLIRLLLGFEQPQQGRIYYDRRDIRTLNLRGLRGNIGCVMQNSRLFPGSIYSNITISAPGLSEAQAWEAARMAGIADDIRRMPMQMNTMISEGMGTLSGGQTQRILIARAIAQKPRVLLFDEATSALDNLTQKQVSDSLAGLKCTRIVIAHRLSTVRNCDRILFLEGGTIAEEGTYDELMERNGLFRALVERQLTQ